MAVEFLPERLNRPPVVFRGLTSAEMFMSFFSGAALGIGLGIAIFILSGYWAVIPTATLLAGFLCVFFAGKALAIKKRGRAVMWLYRSLQARLTLSSYASFFEALGVADRRLVLQESSWSLRRK
ncbi:TIGR03750 family conjugal transfer protein [Pseudomonas sp. GOM7]|uniref:TIGR03750 family conjugal transfer protein n=1 Tax=Pseudomonas sp. GOM7 TaxID=2998079 RepID=UPI00227B3369|nr:TIGR03750 family conjugal transfer protein [Pseudomonas sp. GOM7]WAJ37267.1 TIGR03750 family conjugal transfer protein [Pseudomonas sp. GOM7]